MKRRAEFLVDKRDGRREWLRRTKLAHSIHMAFHSADIQAGDEPDPEPWRAGDPEPWRAGDPEPWRAGDLEPWRAVDLASAVLTGLRSVHGQAVLTTHQLAAAVARVLMATGFPLAADAYERCGAERRRRRWALGQVSTASVGRLLRSDCPGMVGRPPAGDRFRG